MLTDRGAEKTAFLPRIPVTTIKETAIKKAQALSQVTCKQDIFVLAPEGAISIELDSFKMNFWNSFQKVATWSAASYLYVRWFLEIVSIFLLDNKYVIMCFTVSFMTSWTIILYFTTDVWLLYVARLIAGSVMMVYYCMFMRKLMNTKKKLFDNFLWVFLRDQFIRSINVNIKPEILILLDILLCEYNNNP
ncbi:hypothetical protein AGLY_012832 [Aphis glycines]|uniref:Uncharacterized protein n=1 Tax=Aphis glycines TaxID=307491 RepID=A0A6G0TAE9_APHGL|nr:hypothetical protein AGLY_012832 [Aphis glycines]